MAPDVVEEDIDSERKKSPEQILSEIYNRKLMIEKPEDVKDLSEFQLFLAVREYRCRRLEMLHIGGVYHGHTAGTYYAADDATDTKFRGITTAMNCCILATERFGTGVYLKNGVPQQTNEYLKWYTFYENEIIQQLSEYSSFWLGMYVMNGEDVEGYLRDYKEGDWKQWDTTGINLEIERIYWSSEPLYRF